MDNQSLQQDVKSVGSILNDRAKPLAERFRALFTLRNLGGPRAIESIAQCFDDPSELLKHECAYCLGQMQDEASIPVLLRILSSKEQESIVRHEAGEALGAIGTKRVLPILKQFSSDPITEVSETCKLAVSRIEWLHNQAAGEQISDAPYKSVDPAPPFVEHQSVDVLKRCLLDESRSLFERYRAMFSLRNLGSEEAVLALAEGLKCSGALFRHEVAYVLGQIQHPAAVDQLSANLSDGTEHAMVRHECAEALGSIATPDCQSILRQFQKDSECVVRESCEVALDMWEYENSEQFQYADGLAKVQTETPAS